MNMMVISMKNHSSYGGMGVLMLINRDGDLEEQRFELFVCFLLLMIPPDVFLEKEKKN